MDTRQLAILIGTAQEAVLFDNELIAGLTAFELNLDSAGHIQTKYECCNCFPRRSGHRLNDTDTYPLCVYVNDNTDLTIISYAGRQIGYVVELYVRLNTTQKRAIRLTTAKELPPDLTTALLDLGVELVTL